MKVTGANLDILKQPKVSQLSFRGGDFMVLWPEGGMLHQPWTKILIRGFCRWNILPFLSVKIGRFGFYLGFKGVGWDDTYTNWMPKDSGDFLILTARGFTDG